MDGPLIFQSLTEAFKAMTDNIFRFRKTFDIVRSIKICCAKLIRFVKIG